MIKSLLALIFIIGMLLIYSIGILITTITNSKMKSYYEQELKQEFLKKAFIPGLQISALIKLINYESEDEKFDGQATN